HREDVAIVVPPRSILVELPVSIVDKVVDRRGTRELANAYVAFLYDFAAQGLAARHFFRPGDPLVAKHFAASFPELERFGVDEVFGGWGKAQAAHFDAGASFDRTK
ncbi:MAG TPA: sulfate ABC transporter substrate-binding protein, partial [Polyangiaceae bacterium]